MDFDTAALEELVRGFFRDYAYHPELVYSGIFLFMWASSFGLPLPEEIVLVSAGFLAFTARHPELAPPPEPGATPVSAVWLAVIATLAVISSDLLIFWLGHRYGRRILKKDFVKRFVSPERQVRIEEWSKRYGYWASGIFRFTPGLRFPGHLFCGISGMPAWKFLAVDGTAAILTVPTQILLIAHYGDRILRYFREFKLVLLGVLAVAGLAYFIRRLILKRKAAAAAVPVKTKGKRPSARR